MRFLLIIILILFWQPVVHAQADSSFRLLRSMRTAVADLAVDHLDNLYILTTSDQLIKYNARGDSAGVYNQVRRFGKLHSIDVTNPLKLLLYYKDFSAVVVLDRLLTPRATVELRRLGLLQSSAIGLSYDNHIWLYDEYENKLKKISEEGDILLETADFRMIFPESVVPQQIIDQNGTVYLNDPKSGVYLFDYYGSFKKKLPITQWKQITVAEPYVFGIHGNRFHYFNTSVLLSGQKELPWQTETYQFRIGNNKLFSWNRDSLQVYRFPFSRNQ